MPRSTPSLVPSFEFDTYLVLDDFGTSRIYHETNEVDADRATVMRDISQGQYKCPVRVVSFNIAEGWSRDVTKTQRARCSTTHRGLARPSPRLLLSSSYAPRARTSPRLLWRAIEWENLGVS